MLLKKGDQNEDVKKLQVKLGVDPIGTFGSKTEDAVKAFQTKNGLTPDGIVGPKTWEKIMNENVDSTSKVINKSAGLKLDKLKGHLPDSVIAEIPTIVEKFKIDTPLEMAHFLAQCAHESGNFEIVSENLNYSAERLKTIFPKYFRTVLAESYERNPQKIANFVYGNRMGNGSESSGDGFRFRGRGYIQLTGRSNYAEFDKFVNEDILSNPDLVSTKYPLLSAAWFFSKNCLNRCKDASDATVTSVTRCVNGATIGLSERLKEFKTFFKLLS